ncbi:hypothetical protein [Bailinhaonella thermotolerans]|uniref:Tetratricopeptide repeat protein n=1 Tax=Bailinhaonella thermotolerans TaxID=1070861 RepID=A0A3A4AY72_9ACTN|nr:hypothetical protein [Bailinhaonella thermotolerans]RJL33349.1 hypothetical protein D5H75_11170 [Bailinhaonella thermotolerans]
MTTSIIRDTPHDGAPSHPDGDAAPEDDPAPPGRLFYTPWRDHPVPLTGLLDDVRAWLDRTESWLASRRGGHPAPSPEHAADPPPHPERAAPQTDTRGTPAPGSPRPASGYGPGPRPPVPYAEAGAAPYGELEYAWGRREAGRALDIAAACGELTGAGERFVAESRARMRAACAAAPPVPDELDRLAGYAAEDHRVLWRLRHLRPDPAAVESLTRAWISATPRPAHRPGEPLVVPAPRPLPPNARLALLSLRARARVPRAPLPPYVTDADLRYAEGEHAEALELYRARIEADPADLGAWAGLTMSRRPHPHQALARVPELVHAVHRRIDDLTARAPDPEALAAWLRPALPSGPGTGEDG